MTADELVRRVVEEGITKLESTEWRELEGAFEVVARHDTFIAGELIVARRGDVLLAVERPAPGLRVARRLRDDDEVSRFVTDRLDTYERMWDGCGCKVEYYR